MNYRIVRLNENNWQLEQWFEAGEAITRGPQAGTVRAEGFWSGIPSYHNRLEHAAAALLDRVTGDYVQAGKDILTAIQEAKREVMEVARNAETKVAVPPSGAATPANRWETLTDEEKEQIRLAKSPSAQYLRITGGKRFKRTSDETRRGLSPDQATLERVG